MISLRKRIARWRRERPARANFGGLYTPLLLGIYILVDLVFSSAISLAEDPPEGFYTPSRDSVFYLERFDYPDQVGQFPKHWEARSGWRLSKTRIKEDLYYTIQKEEDNLYLKAYTVGRATNAGRAAPVNLRIYNRLRWRWRIHSLPEGGDETKREKNDSASAVRIVFTGRWPVPKTLKYVWSTTLPVGTETESPDSDRTKVIVLESGSDRLGEWVWEEVDAYRDYKRLFGGEPRLVKAIAVITDSDNTLSPVEADYDDFTFLIGRLAPVEIEELSETPDTLKTNP